MLEDIDPSSAEDSSQTSTGAAGAEAPDATTTEGSTRRRRRAASRPAGPPPGETPISEAPSAPLTRRAGDVSQDAPVGQQVEAPAAEAPKKPTRRRATRAQGTPEANPAAATTSTVELSADAQTPGTENSGIEKSGTEKSGTEKSGTESADDQSSRTKRSTSRRRTRSSDPAEAAGDQAGEQETEQRTESAPRKAKATKSSGDQGDTPVDRAESTAGRQRGGRKGRGASEQSNSEQSDAGEAQDSTKGRSGGRRKKSDAGQAPVEELIESTGKRSRRKVDKPIADPFQAPDPEAVLQGLAATIAGTGVDPVNVAELPQETAEARELAREGRRRQGRGARSRKAAKEVAEAVEDGDREAEAEEEQAREVAAQEERAEAVADDVEDAESTDESTDDSDDTDSDDTDSDDSDSDDSGDDDAEESDDSDDEDDSDDNDNDSDDVDGPREGRRRRRRRGGRRRRRGGSDSGDADEADSDDDSDDAEESDHGDEQREAGESTSESGRRRRRRRRRRGEDANSGSDDDPSDVVVRVREPRRSRQSARDEVTGIEGSTRVAAKKLRRQEGRAAGRRRAPILSEAEFLARRESVDRRMIIRQRDDYTQLAVLEDGILVEHYVDRDSSASMIGNIYLGRVQNVLPGMEAAFIDIGRGRNAVLYAGELDWEKYGVQGEQRKIENVFKSGQTVLVQVTKDPVGAKGARLTSHISIPGRYLVYSPGGHLSGISRKLADAERSRLKDILGHLLDEKASVIVRTAAEGVSEDELVRDVNRLKAQWEIIEKKVKQGSAPAALYGEPDLTVRIVRDLFTEDFSELSIQGNGSSEDAFDEISAYVGHVAPHLAERVRRWQPDEQGDIFAAQKIDEQISKALERKVFLPSGGSLIIDRTEAMTVIDVNTGRFTGTSNNLEATVTSNNLEAAEEIVRQLRLRDVGGIIVIDFIDMVLPANRDLLIRRLVECLSRDRTRHQVAEVTSLGLVQMTRKKIGTGLAEAFTEECDHCGGRGYSRFDEPVESQAPADGGERHGGRGRGRGGKRRGGRSGNQDD